MPKWLISFLRGKLAQSLSTYSVAKLQRIVERLSESKIVWERYSTDDYEGEMQLMEAWGFRRFVGDVQRGFVETGVTKRNALLMYVGRMIKWARDRRYWQNRKARLAAQAEDLAWWAEAQAQFDERLAAMPVDEREALIEYLNQPIGSRGTWENAQIRRAIALRPPESIL